MITNKEAIEILKQQKYPYPEHYKDIEVNEALDLAIKALEERPQDKSVGANNRHSAEYYDEEGNICDMTNLATVEFYRSDKTGKIYADFVFEDGRWATTKEIFPEEFNNLKSDLISFSDMGGR